MTYVFIDNTGDVYMANSVKRINDIFGSKFLGEYHFKFKGIVEGKPAKVFDWQNQFSFQQVKKYNFKKRVLCENIESIN